MVDIIAPTDGAVVFYALIGIALLAFVALAWFKGRNEHRVRDWEEGDWR